ncbi:MAG TPA: hypothetical protein VEH05_03800, partial [Streptosporangiaceae bacterium]|nr:hypothetical protein [Streptosporangiaceae bacterium]
ARAAARWASVLGLPFVDEDGAATIRLPDAHQDLRFVPAGSAGGEGITEVRLTTDRPMPEVRIGGVRFVSTARPAGGEPG